MAVFTDDLGRRVTLPAVPQRIVSLVPSQTELLHHLGLDAEVAGITKFCVHPKHWHQSRPRVGGTKKADLEKIKRLQPDLILANKEENVQEQIEALAHDFPVWVSDVNTLEQALHMIRSVGALTGKSREAANIIRNIQKGFETFETPRIAPGVVYLIWQDPFMTVGGDTFIGNLLLQAGYTNLFVQARRYPAVTAEELISLQPELLFLSSEPYPFGQKHLKAFQNFLPHTKVVLVDGEMFSWYGSRLREAPAYFRQLQQQIETV